MVCCKSVGPYFAFGVVSVQPGPPTRALNIVTINATTGVVSVLSQVVLTGSTDPGAFLASDLICCQGEGPYFAFGVGTRTPTSPVAPARALNIVTINSLTGIVGTLNQRILPNSLLILPNVSPDLTCCKAKGPYFAFGAVTSQAGPPTRALNLVTINAADGIVSILNQQNLPDSTGVDSQLVCCYSARPLMPIKCSQDNKGDYFAFGVVSTGQRNRALNVVAVGVIINVECPKTAVNVTQVIDYLVSTTQHKTTIKLEQ